MKFSVFIATSLDGFIAKPDGSVDWLNALNESIDHQGQDYGYKAFSDSIDYMVMGRKSLETVLSFGVPWPYEGKKVIVLSRTLQAVPAELEGKIELYSGDLLSLKAQLKAQNCRRVYVDGGMTIQTFLQLGLLSDLTITTIPILLGEGIPLFGTLPNDIHLKHIETQSYPSGFVQSLYEIDYRVT